MTDAVPLSRSKCLELLASKRRQTLLELLVDSTEDTHSLESLATAIAQTEQETDLGARPDQRVCLSLHHVHLPKLDAADIVEYDPQRNVVEYLGSERMEQLLDSISQ
jgi:hypothetical protein